MIWHYNRSVKLEAFPVIMQTVPDHSVPGFRRKRISIAFAECHEQCASRFLVVRQFAPVFIHPVERRVGRTLLSVAFDFGSHTTIALESGFLVCDE